MRKVYISEEIRRRRDRLSRRVELSQAMMIEALKPILFSNISEFATWDTQTVNLYDSETVDDDALGAIVEVASSPGKYGSKVKIRLHDKLAAWSTVAKMLGWFEKKSTLEVMERAMTRKLVVGLILAVSIAVSGWALAQQEPSAPKTPPPPFKAEATKPAVVPEFGQVITIEKNQLILSKSKVVPMQKVGTREVIVDGKKTTQQFTYTVETRVPTYFTCNVEANTTKVETLGGKKVEIEKLKGTWVLLSAERIEPTITKLFKEETVVIVAPQFGGQFTPTNPPPNFVPPNSTPPMGQSTPNPFPNKK